MNRLAPPRRWLSRLVRVPTAFHLLCAERESRAADARRLPSRSRGEWNISDTAPSLMAS